MVSTFWSSEKRSYGCPKKNLMVVREKIIWLSKKNVMLVRKNLMVVRKKSYGCPKKMVFLNMSETIVFAKILVWNQWLIQPPPKRLNLGKRVMFCFYNYLPGHGQDMVSGSKWFFGTKWGVCSWVEREVHLDFWGWEWDIVFEEL